MQGVLSYTLESILRIGNHSCCWWPRWMEINLEILCNGFLRFMIIRHRDQATATTTTTATTTASTTTPPPPSISVKPLSLKYNESKQRSTTRTHTITRGRCTKVFQIRSG
eukprot:TRINITY_DN3019_c0_g2_i1.p1 TRINITY_DN3019_c0_g2~~TRINITY_DN3019_c0_g2_i1.p1  ORF type:complete len:110 (-),score=10.79 TRINITY_DN3019_c0_g2_i1:63-392(-)